MRFVCEGTSPWQMEIYSFSRGDLEGGAFIKDDHSFVVTNERDTGTRRALAQSDHGGRLVTKFAPVLHTSVDCAGLSRALSQHHSLCLFLGSIARTY